jgi:tetratricopeptide (TPR) repeat protein
VRKDIDGAEAAYRAAIAADPGYADAHYNLGHLLQTERKDIDSAEAAYRAVIAADPGFAQAHSNVATLLLYRARDTETGSDLAPAASLYDEASMHYTVSCGADHEWTTEAKNLAARARLRAALV